MPENPPALPDFTTWPSFPFEGDLRVKRLEPPVAVEPPRFGENGTDCVACHAPDDVYIWVSERWRVKATDRPPGLPAVLVLESRSHLDLGDLPNLHAAELGVMTVRLERAIRSLDGVGRVHVHRWGDGSAHLHVVFQARPYGQMQLRGSFLSLWEELLAPVPHHQWQENLGLVAAWLAEFGGEAIAEPPHITWQTPGTMAELPDEHETAETNDPAPAADTPEQADRQATSAPPSRPQDLADLEAAHPVRDHFGPPATPTFTAAPVAERLDHFGAETSASSTAEGAPGTGAAAAPSGSEANPSGGSASSSGEASPSGGSEATASNSGEASPSTDTGGVPTAITQRFATAVPAPRRPLDDRLDNTRQQTDPQGHTEPSSNGTSSNSASSNGAGHTPG